MLKALLIRFHAGMNLGITVGISAKSILLCMRRPNMYIENCPPHIVLRSQLSIPIMQIEAVVIADSLRMARLSAACTITRVNRPWPAVNVPNARAICGRDGMNSDAAISAVDGRTEMPAILTDCCQGPGAIGFASGLCH